MILGRITYKDGKMNKAADNPRKAIVILNASPPKDILPKATYEEEGCRFNSCLKNREACNLIGEHKEELGLSRTTAQILQKLLEHQNPITAQCNPTHKLLAKECFMSLSTVEKGMKKLRETLGDQLQVIRYQVTPMKFSYQYNFSIDSILASKIPNDLATRKGYGQKYKYQRILLRVFLK